MTTSAPFSILSLGPVYGDDWSAWQRDLYPVTYKTDAAFVRAKLLQIEAELIGQRRSLHWHMKSGVVGAKRVVAAYRREIDKLERWARNCRTQLRLIDAARPRQIDNVVRLMPTPALEQMLGGDEQRVA